MLTNHPGWALFHHHVKREVNTNTVLMLSPFPCNIRNTPVSQFANERLTRAAADIKLMVWAVLQKSLYSCYVWNGERNDSIRHTVRWLQKCSACCIQCLLEESMRSLGCPVAAQVTELSLDAAQSRGLKVVLEHCCAHLTNSWACRSHNTGHTNISKTETTLTTGIFITRLDSVHFHVLLGRSLVAFN